MSSPVLPPGALLRPSVILRQRRRRFWAGAGLAVLVALAVLGPSAYRKGKVWRAGKLAAEAEKLLAVRQVKEAVGKAQAAFELAPGAADSLRAMARVYSLAGAGSALGFWKSLLRLPEATGQDRRDAARFALRAEQLDFADEQLQRLVAEDSENTETLELAAQLALQKNDRSLALDSVGRLLARDPKNARAALLQAQLLAGSSDPAEQRRGRRALLEMGRGKDAMALAALLKLAQDTALPVEDARIVAEQLSVHPDAGAAEKLAAVSVRLRAEPARRAELIDQACAQFGRSGPDDLTALSRWLLQQGEAARADALIPPDVALVRRELFLVRLDALGAQGDWVEIQRTLEKEQPPIEPLYVQIFLARAAKELGQDEDANTHWSIALADAASAPEQSRYLAQYAERAGERRVAEKAWRQLARTPAWALRAHLALLPLLQAAGDTRALREEVHQILMLAPKDPAVRNDAAYLDLLLKENTDAAGEAARQLVQEHPEVLAYRTTLALARLRSGETHEAMRLYDGLDIPWAQAPARSQAIHAAVLAAVGQRVTSAVDPAKLLPEERVLVGAE